MNKERSLIFLSIFLVVLLAVIGCSSDDEEELRTTDGQGALKVKLEREASKEVLTQAVEGDLMSKIAIDQVNLTAYEASDYDDNGSSAEVVDTIEKSVEGLDNLGTYALAVPNDTDIDYKYKVVAKLSGTVDEEEVSVIYHGSNAIGSTNNFTTAPVTVPVSLEAAEKLDVKINGLPSKVGGTEVASMEVSLNNPVGTDITKDISTAETVTFTDESLLRPSVVQVNVQLKDSQGSDITGAGEFGGEVLLLPKQSHSLSVNQQPYLEVGDKAVDLVGGTLEFEVIAKDPDGDSIEEVKIISDIPGDAEFKSGTFTWTPDENEYRELAGDHEVTFEAESTGGVTNTQTITITVEPPTEVEVPAEYDLDWALETDGIETINLTGDVSLSDSTNYTVDRDLTIDFAGNDLSLTNANDKIEITAGNQLTLISEQDGASLSGSGGIIRNGQLEDKIYFAGGGGSDDNPYRITNWNHLNNVRNDESVYFGLEDNLFVLENNLDENTTGYKDFVESDSQGWEPINSFDGEFDGKGHTLSDLTIAKSSSDDIGLFGSVNADGIVKRIGIELSDSGISGNNNVGGLVGKNDGGTIKESYVNGDVEGTDNIGGLVGYNTGNGKIENSYTTGTVTATNDSAGGLVGANNDEITNSYATATVAASSAAGGLVGTDSGTVTDSYWDMVAAGIDSSAAGIGKSSYELNQLETFETWNFTDVWLIDEGDTYPYLDWQTEVAEHNKNQEKGPDSILVTPGDIGTVTAGEDIGSFTTTVKDEDDKPVEKAKVTVTTKNGSGSLTNNSTTTIRTDLNGEATFDNLVIETADSYELDFLVSDVDENHTASTDSFEVEPAAASADHSIIEVANSELTANGTSTTAITVTAIDEYDNQLDSGGDTVRISKDNGTLLDTVTDKGDGTYTQKLEATTNVTTATIQAKINSSDITTGDETVDFVPGDPAKIQLTGPDSVKKGETSDDFTLKVLDADDNITEVTTETAFSLSSDTNGTATFTPSSITIDDGSYESTFTYSDTEVADPREIKATFDSGDDNLDTVSTTISISVFEPADFTVNSFSPPSEAGLGDEIGDQVSAEIKNTGGVDGTKTIEVRIGDRVLDFVSQTISSEGTYNYDPAAGDIVIPEDLETGDKDIEIVTPDDAWQETITLNPAMGYLTEATFMIPEDTGSADTWNLGGDMENDYLRLDFNVELGDISNASVTIEVQNGAEIKIPGKYKFKITKLFDSSASISSDGTSLDLENSKIININGFYDNSGNEIEIKEGESIEILRDILE